MKDFKKEKEKKTHTHIKGPKKREKKKTGNREQL